MDASPIDLNEMRKFLSMVEPPSNKTVSRLMEKQKKVSSEDVVKITEHLYRHIQRADVDDFRQILGSRLEAMEASQAVDALYEGFKTDNTDLIIGYSRVLHEKLENCTPDQFSALLGRGSFSGQELDITGLVSMLGKALDGLDGKTQTIHEDNRFEELIQDLRTIITDFSSRKLLNETLGDYTETVLTTEDFITSLQHILVTKYLVQL